MQALLSQANDFLDRSKHEATQRLTYAAQTLPPSLMERLYSFRESFLSFIIAVFAVITVFIGRAIDYLLDTLTAVRRGNIAPWIQDVFNLLMSVVRFFIGPERFDFVEKSVSQFIPVDKLKQQVSRPANQSRK